jgi:2-oxoglutarate ferredoxin oxidoreductase subunit beta
MSAYSCSSLSCGIGLNDERDLELNDYEGPVARWCPGCGDHSVLTAVQKLLVAENKPCSYRASAAPADSPTI